MTVGKFIKELQEKFNVNEQLRIKFEGVYIDEVTIDYDKGIPTIDSLHYEGDDWEVIANSYHLCLNEILELCDEKNLSNPKKIEAIRRRINEENGK